MHVSSGLSSGIVMLSTPGIERDLLRLWLSIAKAMKQGDLTKSSILCKHQLVTAISCLSARVAISSCSLIKRDSIWGRNFFPIHTSFFSEDHSLICLLSCFRSKLRGYISSLEIPVPL